MNINDLVKEFISVKPEGYEKDVRIFIEFLESKGMPLIKEVLQGVRTKTVLESINYYIDTRAVSSANTVVRYISAISEFFKYIIGRRHIENSNFYDELLLPAIESSSFQGRVNEAIAKNKKLKQGDTFEIFTKEEIDELIKNCNSTLPAFEKNLTSKKYYNKFLAALCIKLICLTGVTYRELRKIKINDSIEHYNMLEINEFKFYLPMIFSDQLKYYLNIRRNILHKCNKDSDYLFISINGTQLSEQTSIIVNFLSTCTYRNDLNGLIKFTVRSLIINGVSDSVIKKFTGVGQDIINACLKDITGQSSDINWNQYLDVRLRNTEIFDKL